MELPLKLLSTQNKEGKQRGRKNPCKGWNSTFLQTPLQLHFNSGKERNSFYRVWGERKCNSVILYPAQIFSKKQRQQTKYLKKWKMSANTEPVSSYLRTNPELSTEDAKTKVGTKQWITQNMQLIPEGTGVVMTDGWASRSQLLKATIRSYINQQM